ncbi:TetR family transcriptional regulator [Labrys miyagiensis]
MSRKNVIRGEGTTRQDILKAAAARFSSASYDDVSLREIASDVDVDVAYVHRSFGSKESLFRQVLEAVHVEPELVEVPVEALARHLAKLSFDRSHAKDLGGVDPLSILVRSLSTPSAGRLVGARLQDDFIGPIQHKISDATPFRASMVMSLLIGFSILRNLLQLPATVEVDRAQAELTIAQAVGALMRVETG